jgi:hypothetical protein
VFKNKEEKWYKKYSKLFRRNNQGLIQQLWRQIQMNWRHRRVIMINNKCFWEKEKWQSSLFNDYKALIKFFVKKKIQTHLISFKIWFILPGWIPYFKGEEPPPIFEFYGMKFINPFIAVVPRSLILVSKYTLSSWESQTLILRVSPGKTWDVNLAPILFISTGYFISAISLDVIPYVHSPCNIGLWNPALSATA